MFLNFAEAGVNVQTYNEQEISKWIKEKDVYTSQDLIKLQKAKDPENVLLFAARMGNYKILKSIVDLSKDDKDDIQKRFVHEFSRYNQNGENALHLGTYDLILKP